jgi:heme exporter protein C
VRLRTSENPLAALAALAGVLIAASVALIFFYVPTDADQGFSQRIFYIHVPVSQTASG